MVEESIESLVDAGNATAGPPLGPALGPLGVNAKAVVDEINEKTKAFSGMKVPVKVSVDTETKEFTVTVGSPPTASLLKKEVGVEKGSGDGQPVGDAGFGTILDIAKMKQDSLLANDLKGAVKEVLGTCVSLGVNIEDKRPKDVIAGVDAGEYDAYISGEKEASHEHKILERVEAPKEEEEPKEEGEDEGGEKDEGEKKDAKTDAPEPEDKKKPKDKK